MHRRPDFASPSSRPAHDDDQAPMLTPHAHTTLRRARYTADTITPTETAAEYGERLSARANPRSARFHQRDDAPDGFIRLANGQLAHLPATER